MDKTSINLGANMLRAKAGIGTVLPKIILVYAVCAVMELVCLVVVLLGPKFIENRVVAIITFVFAWVIAVASISATDWYYRLTFFRICLMKRRQRTWWMKIQDRRLVFMKSGHVKFVEKDITALSHLLAEREGVQIECEQEMSGIWLHSPDWATELRLLTLLNMRLAVSRM